MMPFMFFFNFKFGSSKIKLVEKKFNDTLIHETLHNWNLVSNNFKL